MGQESENAPLNAPLIVAIDGPSGVGKTTVSRLVAARLNLPQIDTGAMYRAIALAAVRSGIPKSDVTALEELVTNVRIDFIPGDPPRILLEDEDISDSIRTPEISMAASDISAVPAVRRHLVRLQQKLGHSRGGVLEGRDIGTKVFPAASHKFFLTAEPDVRARRRHSELLARGTSPGLEQVLSDTVRRDTQDSTREDSPLTYDASYEVIDTSTLTIGEVVGRIIESVEKKKRAKASKTGPIP